MKSSRLRSVELAALIAFLGGAAVSVPAEARSHRHYIRHHHYHHHHRVVVQRPSPGGY